MGALIEALRAGHLCFRQLGAAFLGVAGVVLIYMGFWVEPTGNIDTSILVAFGEIMTSMCALLGLRREVAKG